MRPVTRGDIPIDEETNQPKTFSDYKYARKDLIERLGQFCSYCESRLPASLAVEHLQPKSHHPDLRLDWNNFLLACTNCNSTKGAEDVQVDEYFWPDMDNTFIPFNYKEGGLIEISDNLDNTDTTKAENTIELTGLDKQTNNDQASDRRWLNRLMTWDLAIFHENEFNKILEPDFKSIYARAIVDLAIGFGFWSVWMTIFRDHSDVIQNLIDNFPGTCSECFDHNLQPVPRNN